MGTRFMCTMEAPIHVKIKESIVAAQETDTQLVLRKWKNTSRLFKNKVSSEAYRIENDPETKEFKAVGPLVSGARGRQVFVNGDPDFGVCFFFFSFFFSLFYPTSPFILSKSKTNEKKTGLDSWSSRRSHSRYPFVRNSRLSNRIRSHCQFTTSFGLDCP